MQRAELPASSFGYQETVVQAQPAPNGTQANPLDLPDFLRRGPTPPAAPPPAQTYGMVAEPAKPSAEMDAALKDAMNLPLPR
jgi:hypothetical protein